MTRTAAEAALSAYGEQVLALASASDARRASTPEASAVMLLISAVQLFNIGSHWQP
jgi:hypothetical protein